MVVLGLWTQTVPVVVVAVLAGMGIEIFDIGWNLAMQEHVPEEMLSRAAFPGPGGLARLTR